MRKSLHWALLAATFCTFGAAAARADYPEKTVRLIIGQAPGGGTDTAARILAAALSKKWGQPVVVEARPGADGALATGIVARADPDGYTLNYINALHTITPHLQKLEYDPVKSFEPITKIMAQPDVLLINPKVLPNVNSVKDLIAYAKANPGKLNHSSSGSASPAAISLMLLNKKAGIDVVDVPFSGGGPALVALLGGEVQLSFNSVLASLPHVQAGTLKALAVSSARPAPALPDVPPLQDVADVGHFDHGTWNGVIAPAGTPKEIVQKLHDDIVEAVNSPELKEKYAKVGMFVDTSATPAEFKDFLVEELGVWDEIQAGKR